ncbi:hypothetical protein [Mycolicibacterium litorale]|uniref:Uncharacterized protein n=1 Tax=Mycolicibacterium litorale TaxID=758802 RepID=A0AAD1IL74_9MYCO|nr:hypothetical protein [Mycolicibacterium litorale]MCV7415756.1 hypothetical protein [Mycolicibacterium litorale]TDY09010.1 hypothetical protein BCL50_1087 [Mycolicibacterium litorale]BBY16941.1 hypothetical protein MLIT_25330 [Mycolicibacterium litorale]
MTDWQWGWRFCQKCGNMHWPEAGDGVCQTGGGHRPQGLLFALPFNRPVGAKSERNFYFCRACHSLFQQKAFGGGSDLGRCPEGGQHDRTDSFEFVLTKDRPVNNAQDKWAVCVNCHVLWFGPVNGHCPSATHGHNPGGGNFPIFHINHSTDPDDWIP